MALESNLQLISYMATAEMCIKSENIYECFLPIVESVLMIYIDKTKISLIKLQNEINETYHLKVPKSTLKRTLQILHKQKKVRIVDYKKIVPYKDELNASYWDKREERESAVEDFFLEFNSFLVEHEVEIPIAQVKEECCNWLYSHTLELASFISKGNLSVKAASLEESDWQIANELVTFLLEIQNKKSEHFKTFLLLYNGAVQSSLFNFGTEEIDDLNKTAIPFSNIILDTNFILRMLDLQTEFDGAVTRETLAALKEENAHFFVLEQTLDEIIRSIKNFLSDSAPNTVYTNRYLKNSQIKMTGFWEASRRGVTRDVLFALTNKEKLKEKICVLTDVSFVDDYDHTKISSAEIEDLVKSKNRDAYGEIQARHDLSLVDYCRQKRSGNSSKIVDIDWWVLTNDERLTYWNQQNSGQYQECLTEIQLSNIIMLQRKRLGNSGLMQTMVSLSSKTALSAAGIEKFAQKICAYHESNKNQDLALEKLSLVFANNMLTTADIQRINAEEDALDQILEEKVLEVQEEQLLQNERLRKTKEEGEYKTKVIADLENRLNNMKIRLETEHYKHNIDKYRRDISDQLREKDEASHKLEVYKRLRQFEEQHNKSTSRYTLMLITLPWIAMLSFYGRFGYPILKPLLQIIDGMKGFSQDMLVWMIPAALTGIYYFCVGMWLGSLVAPSELFEVLKLKVSNARLKKYMMKNSISLSYLEMDRKQAVADLEMAIKNSERNVESLEHKIRKINETLNRIMGI